MNPVKILGLLLMLLGMLSFSGCAWCEKRIYVDRPVKIKVPVKCVVKDVECDNNGTDSEVVVGLAKCVLDLKQEAKACQ